MSILLEDGSLFSSCSCTDMAWPKCAQPATITRLSHGLRHDCSLPKRTVSRPRHISRPAPALKPSSFRPTLVLVLLALLLLCCGCASAAGTQTDRQRLRALARRGEIVWDRSAPPPSPQRMPLLHRRHNGDDDDDSSTTLVPRRTSTTTTTAADTASSSASIPQPFDTALGSNFSSSTCPSFINSFLDNSTFVGCVPLSLLLQVCALIRIPPLPLTIADLERLLRNHPLRCAHHPGPRRIMFDQFRPVQCVDGSIRNRFDQGHKLRG